MPTAKVGEHLRLCSMYSNAKMAFFSENSKFSVIYFTLFPVKKEDNETHRHSESRTETDTRDLQDLDYENKPYLIPKNSSIPN